MKHRPRASVALGVAVAAMAVAMTPATAGPAGAAPEPAVKLVFDKNPSDPSNSRLLLYRKTSARGTAKYRLVAGYRAGSGTGVKDDCATGKGWMPNGDWRIRFKSRTYDGELVKGYAVYLEDMPCTTGKRKKRTEMFIHSEMNRDGSQGGTERRRWDGDSDYRSNGCVKLRPDHIKALFDHLASGWPTHLRVVA
ncbi:L,D-transpeptidase [Streptomyces sp. NPDC020422]|uniref:L,D-transpeptidase n=1 Tax=Streptomyces sp. NPDC020422 TaxID=3365074 RepID=UPI0037AE8CE5